MDLERIFRKPKLLCTLTTLDVDEFERLLTAFEVAWSKHAASAPTMDRRVDASSVAA